MKLTVAKTMHELRADHRNMAMLLNLLDAEIADTADAQADLNLLQLIMTYMSEYPDELHHPREDLIYRHLNASRSDLDESLARIESDHRKIEQAAIEAIEVLETIAADDTDALQSLVDTLRDYSQKLRKHMYWEEKELFDLADELDDDQGWNEIVGAVASKDDPLFGGQIEKRYKTLFDRIQRFIIWDNQQYFI